MKKTTYKMYCSWRKYNTMYMQVNINTIYSHIYIQIKIIDKKVDHVNVTSS